MLHDLLAVPFDEIAPVLDRSPATTKRLASRARLRVRGTPAAAAQDLRRHRKIVEAFLAASRAADVDAILAVLEPGRGAARRPAGPSRPAGRGRWPKRSRCSARGPESPTWG